MTALAMQQTGIKPHAKIVLYWLADHHNGESGLCFPSLNTLARLCQMTRATVVVHLDGLEAAGLIEREQRRRDNGSQASTAYVLRLIPAQDQPSPAPKKARGTVQNLNSPCSNSIQGTVQNLNSLNLGTSNLGNEQEPQTPKSIEDSREQADRPKPDESLFDAFWASYPTAPRKTDRPKAREAFWSIVHGKHVGIPRTAASVIVAGAAAYAATRPDPQFVPLPTTWLNGERWQQHQNQPVLTVWRGEVIR